MFFNVVFLWLLSYFIIVPEILFGCLMFFSLDICILFITDTVPEWWFCVNGGTSCCCKWYSLVLFSNWRILSFTSKFSYDINYLYFSDLKRQDTFYSSIGFPLNILLQLPSSFLIPYCLHFFLPLYCVWVYPYNNFCNIVSLERYMFSF